MEVLKCIMPIVGLIGASDFVRCSEVSAIENVRS